MACMYTVLVSAFTEHCVQQYEKYGYATAAVSVLLSLFIIVLCWNGSTYQLLVTLHFRSLSNHSFQFSHWLNSNGVLLLEMLSPVDILILTIFTNIWLYLRNSTSAHNVIVMSITSPAELLCNSFVADVWTRVFYRRLGYVTPIFQFYCSCMDGFMDSFSNRGFTLADRRADRSGRRSASVNVHPTSRPDCGRGPPPYVWNGLN